MKHHQGSVCKINGRFIIILSNIRKEEIKLEDKYPQYSKSTLDHFFKDEPKISYEYKFTMYDCHNSKGNGKWKIHGQKVSDIDQYEIINE